jgi:hypothetical protein
MPVLTYACAIETAPGVTVPMASCTALDLARARSLTSRRETLRCELAELISDAIRYDVDLPIQLREAIGEWDGDVLDGERLRDLLRDALLQPA